MKLTQIFGLVAAVHVGVLLVLFAVPGCRSSAQRKADTPTSPNITVAETPSPPPLSPANTTPGLGYEDLNPALVTPGPTAPATGGAVRLPPTRPGTTPPASATTTPTPTVDTYTVVRGDSLWSIARTHNLTVAELAAANNLSAQATLRIDQKLIVPGRTSSPAPSIATGVTPSATAGFTSYTVVPGDTLSGIARKTSTTVAALRSANNLTGDRVLIGQELRVPSTNTTPAPTLTPSLATPSPSAPATTASPMIHVVKPGETLGAIARRYGVPLSEIAALNNITDPSRLRIEQELRIPGWQPATPPTPTPTPSLTPRPSTPSPITPAPSPVGPISPAPAAPPSPANDWDDLDDLSNVPVITVEDTGALRVD